MSRLRRRYGSRGLLMFTTVLPITPLVDVSLMLVVFFIVTSKATEHKVLPVALPKAGSGKTAPSAGIELAIDRDGHVMLGSKEVTLPELKTAAASAQTATLHADADVPHGRVVKIVDVLRQAGVDKIYYATVPTKLEDW